jgi:hypothetical protein
MTDKLPIELNDDEKIPIFAVGDIVKIVPNHKPFSYGLTMKYPHGKELINHICFVEQVLGERYSLYALEKPVKRKCRLDWSTGLMCQDESWYVGDLLESCLEPCSIKCEDCNDLINKMPFNAIGEYKHLSWQEKNKMLLRIKEQEDLT